MAINNLEQRLNNLENKIKALKACYYTAGSLTKAYVQESDTYDVGGSATLHSAEFKFTPKYGKNQRNIISLYPVVTSTYYGYLNYYLVPFYVLPQDGTGDVKLFVDSLTNNMKIKIIMLGTSPGTFTRIA